MSPAGATYPAQKVLADPVRLRLVSLIRAAPQGRAVTRDLIERLEVGQPTVSHHLGVLFDAGFVRREHRGRETWYAIESAGFVTISQLLDPGRREDRAGRTDNCV